MVNSLARPSRWFRDYIAVPEGVKDKGSVEAPEEETTLQRNRASRYK
jgi:hypothetical protein